MPKNNLKIAYLSTWPPRPCGIATFTSDLAHAIEKVNPKISWEVITIDEPGAKHDYDNRVTFVIKQDDFETYKKAAEYINNHNFDLVNLQHEYNLYGGELGEWILDFLSEIKIPIVTTFHTIPFPELFKGKNPKKKIKILKNIASESQKIVTMSRTGFLKLNKEYKIPSQKISIIPHGGPMIERIPIKRAKEKLGFSPSTYILSSYGLIGWDKNYEQIIKALPKIISIFPKTIFLICGQEHPVLSRDYYDFLKGLVRKLNLDKNVIFVAHYLTLKELIQYLQATDIFLHTSAILSLSSSGTLTYAIIAGRSIITTPFVYAKEVLKEKGIFVPLNDSDRLADEIIKVLKNPKEKNKKEEEMYRFGQNLLWPKMAKKYIDVFSKVIEGKNE